MLRTHADLNTNMASSRFGRAAAVWVLLFLSGPSVSSPLDLELSVNALLRPYVESHNFSGTVLIARGDDVLASRGFGMADYENAVPNSAATRFMIASLSKTFTAASILLLQKSGKLQLNDPVDRFVPDFPGGNDITIHQLLSHTSGLPRIVFFPDYVEQSKFSHTTTDLLKWISGKPVAFAPGERYGYSNANYVLLAHIIERASGLSYGDFLRTNFFGPLALEATGQNAGPQSAVEDLARGYVPTGLTEIAASRYYDYSIVTGAGSLYSTAEDLLTWFRAQRRDPSLGGPDTTMEYGWNTGRRLDRDVVVKTGWDGVGFGAQLVHYPASDLTIVVLTNFSVSSITAEIADKLAAIVFGDTLEPLRLTAKPTTDAAVLQDMTGLYRFGPDFYVPDATIRVIERGGQLLIPGDSYSPTGGLLPVSGLEFIHRQQWFSVRFRQDSDGKIVGMQYGDFEVKKEPSH
jgi:CubicO group peptidase (beta-lactamase class C family)